MDQAVIVWDAAYPPLPMDENTLPQRAQAQPASSEVGKDTPLAISMFFICLVVVVLQLVIVFQRKAQAARDVVVGRLFNSKVMAL